MRVQQKQREATFRSARHHKGNHFHTTFHIKLSATRWVYKTAIGIRNTYTHIVVTEYAAWSKIEQDR